MAPALTILQQLTSPDLCKRLTFTQTTPGTFVLSDSEELACFSLFTEYALYIHVTPCTDWLTLHCVATLI